MKVVAVTSCATGIAHSYMAAEAIKRVCKQKKYMCKVETQGALGVENKLHAEEISEADLIVIACDVQLRNEERFAAWKDKLIKVGPHDVVRNPEIIFQKG